jgi:serine beta-lactamase-like protein LACTB, mitochondrial
MTRNPTQLRASLIARVFAILPGLLIVLTLGSAAARRDDSPAGLPAPAIAGIEKAVSAFMATRNAPGLSVAIGTGGVLRWQNGYGLADLEHVVPATASTVYRLASVSKPITAVAVMQLVERRRLSLDDTAGKWVPDLPSALRPITVRQLLSHQSGIRHYTAEEDDSTKHYPIHYASLREALVIFKDDPLAHAPGAAMTYSTYGYTLLGVIVEQASGETYVNFVTRNILAPAGMDHSRPDDPREVVPHRASGYARPGGGALLNARFMDPSYKTPGGGWLSTAGDMVRFGLALQRGRLLRPASITEMTTMQPVAGKDTFYALGWIVGGWGLPDGPRIPGLVWHGGVQQGVTTNLYMLSHAHSVVAIMTNLEGEGLALTQLAADVTAVVSKVATVATSK